MENIIWILIIILIIQKILARAGKNTRFPGPVERIPGDRGPEMEDKPLPGPWNRFPDSGEERVEYNDVPLPGPWNREPGEETTKTAGAGNDGVPERFSREGNDGEIAAELETTQLGDAREASVATPAYAPPEPGRRRERKTGRETGNIATPKVVPPLYRYLSNRHGLAASVVLSEILGKRGGRRHYRHMNATRR